MFVVCVPDAASILELVHPRVLVRHAHDTLHKPDQTWYEISALQCCSHHALIVVDFTAIHATEFMNGHFSLFCLRIATVSASQGSTGQSEAGTGVTTPRHQDLNI